MIHMFTRAFVWMAMGSYGQLGMSMDNYGHAWTTMRGNEQLWMGMPASGSLGSHALL